MSGKSGSSQVSDLGLSFTPTEAKLLALFDDGGFCTREDLMACLDEMATPGNLHVHLQRIRNKLMRVNQTVCCLVRGRKRIYRRMIYYVPMNTLEQDDLPSEE